MATISSREAIIIPGGNPVPCTSKRLSVVDLVTGCRRGGLRHIVKSHGVASISLRAEVILSKIILFWSRAVTRLASEAAPGRSQPAGSRITWSEGDADWRQQPIFPLLPRHRATSVSDFEWACAIDWLAAYVVLGSRQSVQMSGSQLGIPKSCSSRN